MSSPTSSKLASRGHGISSPQATAWVQRCPAPARHSRGGRRRGPLRRGAARARRPLLLPAGVDATAVPTRHPRPELLGRSDAAARCEDDDDLRDVLERGLIEAGLRRVERGGFADGAAAVEYLPPTGLRRASATGACRSERGSTSSPTHPPGHQDAFHDAHGPRHADRPCGCARRGRRRLPGEAVRLRRTARPPFAHLSGVLTAHRVLCSRRLTLARSCDSRDVLRTTRESTSRRRIAILKVPLRKAPTVVHRAAVAIQAWPDESEAVGSNTIDVHITRLRSKMAAPTLVSRPSAAPATEFVARGRIRGARWARRRSRASVRRGFAFTAALVALVVYVVVGVARGPRRAQPFVERRQQPPCRPTR